MKRFLSLVAGALISIGTLSSFTVNAAKWPTHGDFSFVVLESSAIIKKYNGNDEKVVVPEMIDGFPVREIGKNAFVGNEIITDVVLPDTVVVIDDHAFANCLNLENINFPEELEIVAHSAFTTCHRLKKIDLKNVMYIEECAFQLCIDVKEIIVPGTIKNVPDHAFHGCFGVETLVFNEGVSKIESGAATNMYALKRVVIPASVTEIGEYGVGYTVRLPDYTRLNVPIYGYKNTAAETYAIENGFDFVEIAKYGDINSDGATDSVDAALVLEEYAKTSTGRIGSFTANQMLCADIDKNGIVNSSDASRILDFYSYSSTGGTLIPMYYFFG